MASRVTGVTEVTDPAKEPALEIPLVRSVPEFATFYRSEYRQVVGLAFALTGSAGGAEDIAQEAFLAAYRRWEDLATFDVPGAWVRKVVANRAVSAFRRRGVEARGLAKLGNPEQVAPELSAESQEIWHAVRRLPKRQAQVVALFYLEDFSVEQIGGVLDLSAETVRTHLKRARVALRRILKIVEDDDDS